MTSRGITKNKNMVKPVIKRVPAVDKTPKIQSAKLNKRPPDTFQIGSQIVNIMKGAFHKTLILTESKAYQISITEASTKEHIQIQKQRTGKIKHV